jgi:hypothetical protein
MTRPQLDKTHQQDLANNAPVLSHEREEAKTVEYGEGHMDPEAEWRQRYDMLYGRSTNGER